MNPMKQIQHTFTLQDLGFTPQMEAFCKEQKWEDFEIGRVISEHKERYTLRMTAGEYEAEITGNLRFSAEDREDFPAVGDWVVTTTYDSNFAIIHSILPRFSIIKRESVGKFGEIQVIAANIDYAFLVQAVDRDFNINRLERYITICNASSVIPIIILSKTDLIEPSLLDEFISSIKKRIPHVQVIAISNETMNGYNALRSLFIKGKTYCMLGSSGVGKSTLLNNLSGKSLMRTLTISESTSKGRHATSHRELIVLDNGAILIDNPGMREVGIGDAENGLEITFDEIVRLSEGCRFKDCTHTGEKGCAVIHALDKGELHKASYENYIKMQKERAFFESTVADRRKRDKTFGKMVKSYKKNQQDGL